MYTPHTIDTSHVQLSPEMEELLERLAENTRTIIGPADGWRKAGPIGPPARRCRQAASRSGSVCGIAGRGEGVRSPHIHGDAQGDRRPRLPDRTGVNMPEETTKQQEARKKGLADLGQGYAIVRGTAASLDEIARIAYVAKDMRSFSLARKLFALARNHPAAAALPDKDKLKLRQQHGLCTYKDDDLVIDDRLSEALAILNGGDLVSANPSQETLGPAGPDLQAMVWATARAARSGEFPRILHAGIRR